MLFKNWKEIKINFQFLLHLDPLIRRTKYDDTNPQAEKKEYIDHIEEIVQWMGWEPLKV